ncbi:hypothetical protein [Nonomuraea jabiensis]|uniref:hypothetical protein n=1 Tax=Nonomuraea jabiensis TaxID=882448 RepID=UPI003D761D89
MLTEARKAEVDAYLAAFAERDEAGRRPVVRNGHDQPWPVLTSAIEVPASRVDDKRID